MKPMGTTHREADGTFWKNENGQWYHFHPDFKKWSPYVGSVNKNFLRKLYEVSA